MAHDKGMTRVSNGENYPN